jgi:predicted alpha-1,6-mannanase (GH76 family)
LLATVFPASAFTTNDVNAAFTAYTSSFYYQNGTSGYIKDTQTGGQAYFWGQANMIECYLDAYEWHSNQTAKLMITNLLNGFINNNGSSWTWNGYNDDIMWAVMAFTRGGMLTGQTNYCAIAKANFDACYARAWDTKLGGGLYWLYPDNASKNACVNGPGSIAAYLLYQAYGDPSYLSKATSIYNWERSVLFNSSSGSIADNIGTNGTVNGGATTYNQGTFIGAANFLGQTNDAKLAANFTMLRMCNNGILPQYGIDGNNSGFNAIYLRWLVRFMKNYHLQSDYMPWLQTNAAAAWNVRRTWDNLSWCQWQQPSPAGINFYAWDCISSFEAMQAAAPTQDAASLAVPDNENSYWPLDATSGTVAVDSTGSGNNGVVNNATWNANGRFGGCLTFNGSNSSAQITNLLDNDFSIVFWVKTTQTASSGQWYNGAGLVDGDVPYTKNDFGTALVGSKFAFGVGNPDTTIQSSVSINDGAWHQCVATRKQTTGAMCVYVDGVLRGSGTGNRNTLSDPTSLMFGASASGGPYFNGSLDDIKIFTRTLSGDDVAALYASTVAAPTAAPATLSATAGNAQIQLNWADAPLATSYHIKRALVNGGPYSTIANVTATSYTDTSVANSRTYYYVVSAVNSVGESTNSVEANASPRGLVAWLKADDLASLNNGDPVSFWPDASGNGYDAHQALTANRPTFVTGALNGLPVVRFSAANSSYLWFLRPVQDDFTMIFVFRSNQGIGTATDFYSGAGLVSGEVSGAANDFGVSLNANGQVLAGTGNADTSIHSGTGYNNNAAHVVTFKRTKSNGALALYVDSSYVASGAGGTQSLTSPNQLVLGAQQTLGSFLTGDIAEVMIFNSPITLADQLGYERALKCKYGLVGATPAAPSSLALAAGNRQISLNWTLVAGAETYNVWRSTNSGATYQLIAADLATSSYVDTAAANGLVNYYKVTGVDDCGSGTYSAPNNVLLPLPALGMSADANSLTLNWPGWASDWVLACATNLTPPVVWLPVTNSVSTNNGSFSVTLPNHSPACFFRLSAP